MDIGIQEGDSFLAEFMSKLIVGCILFILSMNFWNSLIWVRPNEEYVVDESTVIEWDKVWLGEEFILDISHECVSLFVGCPYPIDSGGIPTLN